jgi:hypothetical protein
MGRVWRNSEKLAKKSLQSEKMSHSGLGYIA